MGGWVIQTTTGYFEEDKCIQSLGVETWSEGTTWKTQT
jgi:hypothetical protein